MDMNKQQIGQYIKSIRKRIGLKQRELAQTVGRDRSTIACYEIGQALAPGDVILTLQRLELEYMAQNGLSKAKDIPIL